MATKKRPFLWGRAFRRVSQLSALFAQHCARCAYEGEHGGSYDGHIAGLRCSQAVVPAYAEGSPVVLAGYAIAVAGAYVAAAPVTAGGAGVITIPRSAIVLIISNKLFAFMGCTTGKDSSLIWECHSCIVFGYSIYLSITSC